MTDFYDDALIAEFVTESREHLSNIEPDLLLLEQGTIQGDAELINRIFRAIHSIKGASGFFGFEGLKRLSHIMENLLMQIRDGQKSPTASIVEALLHGVDKLNILLSDIYNSDTVSISNELNTLTAFAEMDSLPGESAQPTEQFSVLQTSEPEVREPEKNNAKPPLFKKFYYCLEIPGMQPEGKQTTDELVTLLKTLGEVTGVAAASEKGMAGRILFSSVLEMDLIIHATGLPKEQVNFQNVVEPSGNNTNREIPPTIEAKEQPAKAQPVSEPRNMPIRSANGDSSDSIRVRIALLNKLMELAGEMVLSRNQLLRMLGRDTVQELDGLGAIAQNIDLITSDLQEHIMQTRMQPIGSVFNKFPRIIRDIAKQLDKDIKLVIEGEDVELDKSIIESLSDPLTHLIRNCCDHGIELPAERQAQGKPNSGTVFLRAFHQDGQINISITDDGKGIDTDKLVNKVLQKNLYPEVELKTMSPQELANLIFLPGLSTAEQISDISGRGVGMDVVKTNITRLGGQIQIESTKGEGTSILLRLPLTLAIIPSLIVGVDKQRFAVPQVNLVELVHIPLEELPGRIETVGTAAILRLRGQLLPLLHLGDVLEIARNTNTTSDNEMEDAPVAGVSGYNIVVLRAGNNQFGLIVDSFFDTEEIVVKSLSSFLKNCRCFSGATIMGDGLVAMILDPNGIINHTGLSFDAVETKKLELVSQQRDVSADRNKLLLFNNALSEFFAVPLSEVLRVDKFHPSQITRVGHQEFITYEGKGLPLLRLENYLPIAGFPNDCKEAYLIIPKQGDSQVGIVVSRVLDVTEVDCEWKRDLEATPGMVGWAVLQDQLTLKLDINALLQQAGIQSGQEHIVVPVDLSEGEAA